MNIFALDRSPILSARWQHDRHVVKMILESYQLLSTAIHHNDFYRDVYNRAVSRLPVPAQADLLKPTHDNHPAAVWVRESSQNFVWLAIHAIELSHEYSRRFNKSHQYTRFEPLLAMMIVDLTGLKGFWTRDGNRAEINQPFIDYATQYGPGVYCGPDHYAPVTRMHPMQRVIESYRAYYLAEKVSGNRWTHHVALDLPEWLAPAALIHHRPEARGNRRGYSPRAIPIVKPDLSILKNPSRVRLGRISLSTR